MSFSEKVKEEILSSGKYKKCCQKAIRYGELFTEKKEDLLLEELKVNNINSIVCKSCCKKAFLKGNFLGSGNISDPKNSYHFEIIYECMKNAKYVSGLFEEYGILVKITKRNGKYVLYSKNSEGISNILRIFEASNCFMEFENLRIEKSIKNDINRGINCEIANSQKTSKAVYVQMEAIKKIKKNGEYLKLKDEVMETVKLREKYPLVSLDTLASLHANKVTKSCVYHRLDKIIKMANNGK